MITLRKKIALGLATLAVAAAGFGFSPAGDAVARKVNEYEGQHLAKKGSFDITESEDQRIALAGDPSQWGLAGDPSQWGLAGDPSKWGVAGDPSQW